MRIFKDGVGNEWSFELNVFEFKRTRATFGDLLDPEYFLNKMDDAVFVVDLLFALVADQAKERGVDATTFAKSFRGDALDDAKKALWDEYLDFFPSRRRDAMRAALAKIEALNVAAQAKATRELEAQIDRASATEFANASTNTPESPESNPIGERSENSDAPPSVDSAPNGIKRPSC